MNKTEIFDELTENSIEYSEMSIDHKLLFTDDRYEVNVQSIEYVGARKFNRILFDGQWICFHFVGTFFVFETIISKWSVIPTIEL